MSYHELNLELMKAFKSWLQQHSTLRQPHLAHFDQSWEIWFLTGKMNLKIKNSSFFQDYTQGPFQRAILHPIWTPGRPPKVICKKARCTGATHSGVRTVHKEKVRSSPQDPWPLGVGAQVMWRKSAYLDIFVQKTSGVALKIGSSKWRMVCIFGFSVKNHNY